MRKFNFSHEYLKLRLFRNIHMSVWNCGPLETFTWLFVLSSPLKHSRECLELRHFKKIHTNVWNFVILETFTCAWMLEIASLWKRSRTWIMYCTNLFVKDLPWFRCFSFINSNLLWLLSLLLLKKWQCKAGRERSTPCQSEDLSPSIPTHRIKEEKG